MKKGIHPEFKKCIVTCACGETFETMSNEDTKFVESCSKCNQFYTGSESKHKKDGNVAKFNKKYNLN